MKTRAGGLYLQFIDLIVFQFYWTAQDRPNICHLLLTPLSPSLLTILEPSSYSRHIIETDFIIYFTFYNNLGRLNAGKKGIKPLYALRKYEKIQPQYYYCIIIKSKSFW